MEFTLTEWFHQIFFIMTERQFLTQLHLIKDNKLHELSNKLMPIESIKLLKRYARIIKIPIPAKTIIGTHSDSSEAP